MVDRGFPSQHTTTTTVETSNTTVHTNLRFDADYFRTIPGVIKCGEVVLNLIVFLSVAISQYSGGRLGYMSFFCGLGFWVTGLLLVFYLFHAIEKFYKVPWLKIELIYSGIWALNLFIGSTMCAAYMGASAVFGVVAFLGYIVMILYGYDAFLKFRAVQSGEIAQGERRVEKTTTTAASSPAGY